MYLSNYKNHNILIWAFSYETQQNRTIPWTLFLSRAVLVIPSFGHNPVLRAACYGQSVTGSVLRAERSAAALRFARNTGGGRGGTGGRNETGAGITGACALRNRMASRTR